jgi:hypothetical protein
VGAGLFLFSGCAVGVSTHRRRTATTSTTAPTAARPCRSIVGTPEARRVACQADAELASPATARSASPRAASASARSSGRPEPRGAPGVSTRTPPASNATDSPPARRARSELILCRTRRDPGNRHDDLRGAGASLLSATERRSRAGRPYLAAGPMLKRSPEVRTLTA